MAKLGLDAVLYRLTSGTRASWGSTSGGITSGPAPSDLEEVSNVRDLSINLEKGEADVSKRGTKWKLRLSTLRDGSIEFGMVYDPDDAGFAAIMGAWLNDETIAFAALDGDKDTEGVQGLWADFEVFNVSKTENLEEGQMVTVSIKPTSSDVDPEWVEVTA